MAKVQQDSRADQAVSEEDLLFRWDVVALGPKLARQIRSHRGAKLASLRRRPMPHPIRLDPPRWTLPAGGEGLVAAGLGSAPRRPHLPRH